MPAHPVPAHPRPAPRDAYAQWTDACARAGWAPREPERHAERLPLRDALDRVTAAPVTARWPAPLADCAAMDGIAIDSARAARRVPPADFAWIDTGDPLPAGTDTVVKREYVTIDADGTALIGADADLAPWHHVRRQGEDFAEGQVLVPAGRRLRPADLAVAAAAGHATLAVARRPAVAIIPTGDEIRPAGTTPRHGEIIDSNSVWLTARCARAGAEATVSDIIPDEPDLLAAQLRLAAAEADLVLVIAGSSRGRGDHTAAVLAQVGGLAVAGVAVRPGHPALLGHAKAQAAGTVPVVGLPGYPIATAVTFELFAAPLLAALAGDTAPRVSRPSRPARLARAWTSNPDLEEWVPVTLSADGVATPAGHGAGATSHLANATAWWIIPAGQGHFPAAADIEITPAG